MPLTADKLATYESSLREERRRILVNIESLTGELGSSLTDESEENGLETHLGDTATITFLRERNLTIEEHEEHLLHEIDEALKFVQEGTYGTCRDCGADIPEERLEALPWATRCIQCQEKSGS